MKPTPALLLAALLLAACSASTPAPPLPPARSVIKPTILGTQRSYILRLPKAYDGKTKLPMVMLLHGATDSAEYAEKAYHYDEKGDKENFILVLPDALGDAHAWDSSGDGDESKNDLAFLESLLTDLPKNYAIDPKRVFVCGHSAGAIMTYRLACEHPDQISAIGIVAGVVGSTFPKPKAPVPIIAFHGKQDDILPFDYLAQALAFWCEPNHCNPKPTKAEALTQTVSRFTFTPTDKTGADMVAYTLDNGNHMWPGGNKMPGKTMDPVQDISATDIMWDFFKTHPRP